MMEINDVVPANSSLVDLIPADYPFRTRNKPGLERAFENTSYTRNR